MIEGSGKSKNCLIVDSDKSTNCMNVFLDMVRDRISKRYKIIFLTWIFTCENNKNWWSQRYKLRQFSQFISSLVKWSVIGQFVIMAVISKIVRNNNILGWQE